MGPGLSSLQSRPSQSSLEADWQCSQPVVLFIFNRPETTHQVLSAIRAVKPPLLFVVADGPRADHPEDGASCAATRALIDQVDWDCAVRKDFASENLGIKQRVESGLDWVFADTGTAIVLEDDCSPHPTFFRFCEELLGRYEFHDRVMTISGTDLSAERRPSRFSYRFSRYPVTWGWATWRRAWRWYDPLMTAWTPSLQSSWLDGYLGDTRASQYWSYIFNSERAAPENWDYAWTFSSWQHDGLSIHPNVNLVSNIGFGAGASHTLDLKNTLANCPVEALSFPLQHPETVSRDAGADTNLEEFVFAGNLTRMLERVRRLQLRERESRSPASGV